MKKFSFAKIASLVFVCAMLLCAFAVTTLAADDPAVEIVSNNAYYGEKYQLIFAVNAPEGASVSATDSKGNTLGVASFAKEPNPVVNGVQCKAYIIKEGVAAQALDEVITFTVEYNGKVATKSYSFLQYVYERMYVSNIAVGAEREMFEALLSLADVADIFLDRTDADKTISNYKYVTVVDGTLDGDNKAGMFLPGATPFANIVANADYDNTAYNVEWYVSVDGADAVRYDSDTIKTVQVTGNMTVTRFLVESECAHEWSDATCETLATCSKCGETTGDYAEHTWVDATCEAPKTCSVCEKTEGELAEHTWSDWSVSDATCTENGSKSRECSVCSETETETIDATGIHTWGNWNVTAGATCSKAGEQSRTCTVCGDATETVALPATGAHADATADGKCDGCGGVIVISYTLVTDVKDLEIGDKFIIVAVNSDIAMGANKGSNHGGVAVVKSQDKKTLTTVPETVLVITLTDGSVTGSYGFSAGGQFLYAASSSGNQLKLKDTLDVNGSWFVTIEDGVATIKAENSSNRNWMRYNPNNGTPIFSCYASGQQDIAIYVQTVQVRCAHDELTDVTIVDPTCTEKGSESGICVVCDEPVVKEIPAKGHTEEAVPAVDATCGKDGLTAGVVCTVCKTTLVEQEVVYATGEHADGDSDGFCDVCKLDMNTDEAKAEQVLAGITGPADVTEAGDFILDIINDTAYEATITWAITGGTNTASSVNGNTLTVVLADKESTLQLTVTVTVGEASKTQVYSIDVAKKPVTVQSETVSKTASEINNITAVGNGTNHALDSNVTVTFAKGGGTSNPAYNTGSSEIRIYQAASGKAEGGSVTISCDDKQMTYIEIKCTSKYAGNGYISVTGGNYVVENDIIKITVTDGATNVVIKTTSNNSSNRIYIQKISVTYQ